MIKYAINKKVVFEIISISEDYTNNNTQFYSIKFSHNGDMHIEPFWRTPRALPRLHQLIAAVKGEKLRWEDAPRDDVGIEKLKEIIGGYIEASMNIEEYKGVERNRINWINPLRNDPPPKSVVAVADSEDDIPF